MNIKLNTTEAAWVYKALRVQIKTLRILNNRIDSDWIQEEITTLENLSELMADELRIKIHPAFPMFGVGYVNNPDQRELGILDLIETIKGEIPK